MITKDKVIEIFCIIDEFDKNLSDELSKNLRLPSVDKDGLRRRNRPGRMSESEIMTVLVCYHFGTYRIFKDYYLTCIRGSLKDCFPDAVSYNRFVELMPRVFFLMMLFMKLYAFGKCTGITFVDNTMIPRVPQPQEVYEQGFRRSGPRRERYDGMVPRLQAASAVQRRRGHHNLLPDWSKRGRQGRKGMEGIHQGTLREGLCRQGIYQEGTFRITLRTGHTSRTWDQGQYEEQAHAHVG